MLKNYYILFIVTALISFSAYAYRDNHISKGASQYECFQQAYWGLFEKGLESIVDSQQMSVGSVIERFRRELDDDFDLFITRYYSNPVEKDLKTDGSGVSCKITATLSINKLRSVNAQYATNIGHGKHRLGQYKIALMRDKNNREAVALINKLQYSLKQQNHTTYIYDSGIEIGRNNNNCNLLNQQLKKYQRKGVAYSTTVDKYQAKVNECGQNKDIDYVVHIESIAIDPGSFTGNGLSGNLRFQISMTNTQSGFNDEAIPTDSVTGYGDGSSKTTALNDLRKTLMTYAVREVTKNMNAIFMKRSDDHKQAEFEEKITASAYTYTVSVHNVTSVQKDRRKSALVRTVMKQLTGSPARRDARHSTNNSQVYHCGSDRLVDPEDFQDALYATASQSGYSVRIEQDSTYNIHVHYE